ncbi:MAG: heterodisulfide reductase-related iron-sulfur binding cluster, partial [Planctomycetota bacterium]
MRTPYLREMYGEVYALFEQVKELFDPRFLLNPLNKVPSTTDISGRSITSFLRVGEDYARQGTGTILDDPGVLEEIEKCHGCGKCRTYCPLMRVGKEEKYSARAKANLLRGVVSGRLDADLLLSAEFKANLDLCISCEQCLVECPTQVDIPGISMVFREQFVDRKGKGGMVADMLSKPDKMGKVGQGMAGVTNVLLKNRFLRGMAQSVTGLDERRKLPQYKKPQGVARLKQLDVPPEVRAKLPEEVVVFPGCYAEYYDPDGEKNTLIEILGALGVTVHTPSLNCCGISKITQGDSRGARGDIEQNVDKLLKPVRRGAKVVFSAPSCMLSAKREWSRIVDADDTREVAEACVDAHQLLLQVFDHPHMRKQLKPLGKRVAWHLPCHSKVLNVGESAKQLIDLVDEATTVSLNAGCCGLSGTFGLKTDNFDMSMKIAQPMLTKINLAHPDVVTSSCGICQSQIRQGVKTSEDGKDGVQVVHPLRLLYEALRS